LRKSAKISSKYFHKNSPFFHIFDKFCFFVINLRKSQQLLTFAEIFVIFSHIFARNSCDNAKIICQMLPLEQPSLPSELQAPLSLLLSFNHHFLASSPLSFSMFSIGAKLAIYDVPDSPFPNRSPQVKETAKNEYLDRNTAV
jgi:hypothetical protein